MKRCAACGENFAPFNSMSKYCSHRCARLGSKRANCVVCGVEIPAGWPSKPKRTCGSHECVVESKVGARRGLRRERTPVELAAARERKERRRKFDSDIPGEKRTVCARPGCTGSLNGQASIYCSPRCHYIDRSRSGLRREIEYHRCAACGVVFRWNGRGKGACCSGKCASSLGARAVDVEVVDVVSLRGHRRSDFRDETPCCRACPKQAAHNHHVVFRQHVERAGGDRWDPRNALGLCLHCHVGKAHALKLPLTFLRDENYEFAFELMGLAAYDYLRRRYDGEDARLDALLLREAA